MATGAWKGVLGAGKTSLNITLDLTQQQNGEYTAELSSVEQGAQFSADTVAVQGRAVKLEIKAIGGVYQGTLNDGGTEIGGTWEQTGVPAQPLTFERSTDADSAAAAAPAVPPGPTEKPFTVPLEVSAPVAPAVFSAGGRTHLAYELRVTNVSPWNCVISGLDVVVASGGSQPLATFSQADIERMTQRRVTPKSRLAPEASAIVYVWVTLEGQQAVPAKLVNRLRVTVGDYAEVLTLDIGELTVAAAPAVIGAPLKGDRWLAANGPSNTSGHRRARIPVGGHAAIAQRFAIDWVRVDKDGKTFRGDPLENESYYASGAEALAVADGVVAAVYDGLPQNVPGIDSRAIPITLETVGGNYVILDIGGGRYAFYAHLQPGSLRVKPGDKVRRGQVVGLVGNTGNSTEPHLHFHLSDGPSPLGAEGVPYALASFEAHAHADMAKVAAGEAKRTKRTQAIPAENEVVRFDESAR